MPVQKKPKQLPRYYRAKNPPRIRSLKDYLSLLELIQSYRFLNTTQIIALTGISRVNTSIKLQKLYHNGYVDRYTIPTTEHFRGPSKIIYTLDKKGAELLTAQDPNRFKSIYYPKRKRCVYFVEHALMISNFRACLTLALRERRCKTCLTLALQKRKCAELSNWLQGKDLEKKLNKYRARDLRLLPDAYFVIKVKNKSLHYFFEADRATMPLTRFYEKIKRYRKFFSTYRKRLPPCFRVLTLTPTAKRADNLRVVTIKGDPKKEGSERFWFTDEQQFSLENPSDLLSPIIKIGFREIEKKRLSLLD